MHLPPITRRRRVVYWAKARFDRVLASEPVEARGVDCEDAFRALPWRVKLAAEWWFLRVMVAVMVYGGLCWLLQEEPT